MAIISYIVFLLIFNICASVEINVARTTSTTQTPTTDPSNISTTSSTLSTSLPTSMSTTSTTITPTTTPLTTTTKIVPTNATGIKNANETGTANTTTTNTKTQPKKIDRHSLDNYFCRCDLKIDICDVNCCCDIDCTDDMKRIFNCRPGNELNQFDFGQYDQGLPSCEISSSLFCVLDESGGSKSRVIESAYNFDQTTAEKFNWPNVFGEGKHLNDREFYRFGDPILLYNEISEEVENFKIPYSLNGKDCQIDKDVVYLDDIQTKCIKSSENLIQSNLKLLDQLSMVKILRVPNYIRNDMNSMEHCTGEDCDCLEFEFFDCSRTVMDCERINSTDLIGIDDERNGVWDTIEINFRHNFSTLLKADILFIKSDDGLDCDADNTRLVTYSVKFLTINESSEQRIVSGNLGYDFEAPLIATKYFRVNESDPKNYEIYIDYFKKSNQSRSVRNFIKLPVVRQRNCILNNQTFDSIKLGVNSFSKCNLNLNSNDEYNLTAKSNYTLVCRQFQEKIFQILLNDYDNVTNFWISEYGIPRNNTLSWFKVDTINFPGLEQIQGRFFEENNFVCQNIVLNIKFKFFYGRFAVGKIQNQLLVKKAQLHFGVKLDLNFKLDEQIKVPLYYDVNFYDGSSMNTAPRLSIEVCGFLILQIYFVF